MSLTASPEDHPCELHMSHRPRPGRSVMHHILPLSWGGPSEPENEMWVCDTGHYNIHILIDAWLAAAVLNVQGLVVAWPAPSNDIRKHFGWAERDRATAAVVAYWGGVTKPKPPHTL